MEATDKAVMGGEESQIVVFVFLWDRSRIQQLFENYTVKQEGVDKTGEETCIMIYQCNVLYTVTSPWCLCLQHYKILRFFSKKKKSVHTSLQEILIYTNGDFPDWKLKFENIFTESAFKIHVK